MKEFQGATCVIYARHSTAEQSITVQRNELIRFAESKGMRVVGEYLDEAVSGAAEVKPNLQKLLDSPKQADFLLIREISRVSRERDYLKALDAVRQICAKYNLYILLDNHLIEQTDFIELGEGIQLLVKLYGAADERLKIRDRTMHAKREYAKDPIAYCGSNSIPYGMKVIDRPDWRKGTNSRRIVVPDETKWEGVKSIFTLKAQGKSYHQIAKITGIKFNIVFNTFKSEAIRFYINDPDTIKEGDRRTERNKSVPNPSKHENPYKGLIFDSTGRIMYREVSEKTGRDRYVSKYGGSDRVFINKRKLDAMTRIALTEHIRNFGLKVSDLKRENKRKVDELSAMLSNTKGEIEKIQGEIELTAKKILLLTSVDALALLNEHAEKLAKKKKSLEKEASEIKGKIRKIESVEYDVADGIADDELDAYLRKYVERIEVASVGREKIAVYSFKAEYTGVGNLANTRMEVFRGVVRYIPIGRDVTQDEDFVMGL